MKGSHGMAVASWTFPVTYDHRDFDISILKVCTQVYTHTPNLGDDMPLFCSSSVSDKTFAEQSKSDWETSLSDAGAVVGFGACDFLGDDDDVRCLNVFFLFFLNYTERTGFRCSRKWYSYSQMPKGSFGRRGIESRSRQCAFLFAYLM